MQQTNLETWLQPEFQKMLWDAPNVSGIGPGQSVTLVEAYSDKGLAQLLFDARNMLDGVAVEDRGARLQALFEQVLGRVHPRYATRRPKARLVRLLAAMFPHDMTCLMDAGRVYSVQRLIAAPRLLDGYVAQHPSLRATIREAIGPTEKLEDLVDQSIFCWFLWQSRIEKPDEGAVTVASPVREASALPALSLLPANAQRRALPVVKDNVNLLVSMVREAEQGIGRDDLVNVVLSEAPQLNPSSVGNIISQAMGGLGLIRLDDNTYRPTERGQELLIAVDPVQVLRAPLIGRVFGMGHLLLMVRREPGKLRSPDAAKMLQDMVPTWTSTQPGSHIVKWARIVGLIQVEDGAGGGRLVLTDDGYDFAAALPEDFEAIWQIPVEIDVGLDNASSDVAEPFILNRVLPESSRIYNALGIVNDGCFLPHDEISATVELLRRKKNLILQGPPGTGKTWLAKRLGYALIGNRDEERLTAMQFQPSLSYEDFVRGWRPDGRGGLKLADGTFMDAIYAALEDRSRPYVLVIEEVNRGNPAQIFGELLTLIEDGKRCEEEALRLAYPRTVDERVYVPDNLYIIGTMNLADRSLALVDLALRRRFAFVTLTPSLGTSWREWCSEREMPDNLIQGIVEKIGALNNAISEDRTLGPQFQIGHSFVTPVGKHKLTSEAWYAWYLETVKTEISPLLAEYWFDNPKLAGEQVAKLLVTTY